MQLIVVTVMLIVGNFNTRIMLSASHIKYINTFNLIVTWRCTNLSLVELYRLQSADNWTILLTQLSTFNNRDIYFILMCYKLNTFLSQLFFVMLFTNFSVKFFLGVPFHHGANTIKLKLVGLLQIIANLVKMIQYFL